MAERYHLLLGAVYNFVTSKACPGARRHDPPCQQKLRLLADVISLYCLRAPMFPTKLP